MSKNLPPSQRPERQFPPGSGPQLLGEWMLKYKEHWQAAYLVTGVKDPILISTPQRGLDKPPDQITFVPWTERRILHDASNWGQGSVIGEEMKTLLDEMHDEPVPGRFYCFATKSGVGSYLGLMAPSPTKDNLPVVTVGKFSTGFGVKVRPEDL